MEQSKIANQKSKIAGVNPQLLLADIKLIFTQAAAPRLSSVQLAASLRALPGRPWCDLLKGYGITARWLALHLHPLGIRPRLLWIDGITRRGYLHTISRNPIPLNHQQPTQIPALRLLCDIYLQR